MEQTPIEKLILANFTETNLRLENVLTELKAINEVLKMTCDRLGEIEATAD